MDLDVPIVDGALSEADVTRELRRAIPALKACFDAALKSRWGSDPYGLNPGGITQDPRDGSYWISDKYGPSILHIAADGTILLRLCKRWPGLRLVQMVDRFLLTASPTGDCRRLLRFVKFGSTLIRFRLSTIGSEWEGSRF